MQRLVCLDGLRGVLAFYVMLSHMLPFVPLPAWVGQAFSHGGAGVDVFFILSGLVIVQSLASFGYRPRPFLIARVARIFPVFLLVFAVSVAVQPVASGFSLMPWIDQNSTLRYLWTSGWPDDWAVGVVTHLTMTHGLLPDGVLPHLWLGFLGAAWSLSTEWQFYLLAVLIGARVGLRQLAWLFLALSGVAIAWHMTAPDDWQFSRAFLPNKAQYFAVGIASAIVVREGVKGIGAYLAVLAVALAVSFIHGGIDKLLAPVFWTMCLAAQLIPDGNRPSRYPAGEALRVPRSVLWPLGLLAVFLRSRPLVWLGAVSYGIYLVNEPTQKVLGLVLALIAQGDAMLFTVLWLPSAIAVPIIAAWGLHVWVEVPALRWGRTLARSNAGWNRAGQRRVNVQ